MRAQRASLQSGASRGGQAGIGCNHDCEEGEAGVIVSVVCVCVCVCARARVRVEADERAPLKLKGSEHAHSGGALT